MSNVPLKPYICPQCGGKVNRATLVCEMCGTQFKEDQRNGPTQLIIERPGVVTLGQSISLDLEYIHRDPRLFSEQVIKQLANEFADCIAPYMDIETENDLIHHSCIVRARVRLLKPTYRFT